MGMRLYDPRWFIDPSVPALEAGIRKQNEAQQEYERRFQAGERICPCCGTPYVTPPGFIPACEHCGWAPQIKYGSNLMIPGLRFGFKLTLPEGESF